MSRTNKLKLLVSQSKMVMLVVSRLVLVTRTNRHRRTPSQLALTTRTRAKVCKYHHLDSSCRLIAMVSILVNSWMVRFRSFRVQLL